MPIPWLNANRNEFPPTDAALEEPNGLLAAGGDLSPGRLIQAYSKGIFPWYNDDQPILWWSPDPRCVLYPADVHVSRSLRKRMKQGGWSISSDTHFDEVVRRCAAPRDYADETWINTEMAEAYGVLHRLGHAHSVEAWFDGELVGGLYGIALGKVFFGESMFSIKTDASKVAFVQLCRNLQRMGFTLIDCQLPNPHLHSLGAVEIPRKDFAHYLTSKTTGGGQSCDWSISWI